MENNSAQSEPIVSHLLELRRRVLWAVASVLLVFLCLLPFATDLYVWLAQPLIRSLPEGGTMISTEPHGTFLIPLKFAFACAFALAIPMVLYQIWAFIAPGLYQKEKRIVLPLIVSSTLLFYSGIVFAYYFVFPIIFRFFVGIEIDDVAVMTDISAYMGFVLKLFFAFGFAFEVPVATILLVRLGLVSAESLSKQRVFVIPIAFVAGMLMTPPDIFSQIMLAVPVCILFEIGLFFARKIDKNRIHCNTEIN